jgi:hypothetical protein
MSCTQLSLLSGIAGILPTQHQLRPDNGKILPTPAALGAQEDHSE